jgi:prolyl 4-hydroxylase
MPSFLLTLTLLVALTSAEIIPCPPPHPTRCSLNSPPGSKTIHLTVESATEESFQLYWVDSDCVEKPWRKVSPGASITVTTYPNHFWRAKSTLDDAVVFEHVVVAGQDEKQAVEVLDCKRQAPVGSEETKAEETLAHMKPTSIVHDEKWERVIEMFPKCNPKTDLGADKVPGFYVLCAATVISDDGPLLRLASFRSLVDPIVQFDCPTESMGSPLGIRYCIKTALSLKQDFPDNVRPPKLPDWVMWEATGRRKVHVAKQMLPTNQQDSSTGRLFLFTGGNFIWPGVEVGRTRAVGTVAGQDKLVTIKTMSLRPLVFEVDNFLSPKECDHIIGLAKPHMAASVVSHMDGDEGKSDTTWRTSTTHFLTRGQTELAKTIERRIFDVTRVPITHGEGTQVLRYEKYQHYFTHHDFFEPERYRNSKSTLKMIENGARNRLATVFWYMSDVQKGGHTNFPRAGGLSRPSGNDCTQGVLVKPVKGKVIVFFNMLPDGSLDELSLHAGCNVESDDVKWSANKWLWNKPTRGTWVGDETDDKLQALANNVPGVNVDLATERLLAETLGKGVEVDEGVLSWRVVGLVSAMALSVLACACSGRKKSHKKN